jgi:DNA/RNA-binding domain of Phe-tRNA-synthetase-like protein
VLQIQVTDRWHQTFPEGHVGVLLIGNVDNSGIDDPLQENKRILESSLREQFQGYSRADFLELEVLRAYQNYYKKFDQTYHVQLQLESVVHKAKSLPTVSPLVDANFIAELKTLVLTAGHDADLLTAPVLIDATLGGEELIQMNGSRKLLKPNDMMMSDEHSIICTILYGQDKRSAILAATRRALYVAYAPAGVPTQAVQGQLDSILEHVLVFAPQAEVEMLEIYASSAEKSRSV